MVAQYTKLIQANGILGNVLIKHLFQDNSQNYKSARKITYKSTSLQER